MPRTDELDVHGAHEARGRARVRLVATTGDDDAAAAARIDGELPAECVVDVDHARDQVFAHEQPRLGGAVTFHGAVIVEVVAREIGERGGAKTHRADARLVDRVRGDLHRHAPGAVGPERASVRCTVIASPVVSPLAVRARATGADGAHVAAGRPQPSSACASR